MKTILASLLSLAMLPACSGHPGGTTTPGAPPPPSGTSGWTLLGDTPGPRQGAVAVYDAARDRMLVFGGSGNDLWAQPFSGPDANQWQCVKAGGDVPPPIDAVAVIDEGKDQLMLFPSDSLERAWLLPLDGKGSWSLVGFEAAPQIALGFSLAVDATGRRLFAYTSGTPQMWEIPLDGGTTWRQVADAPNVDGFSCRDDLVFDGANGRLLVLSGGWPRGDVYALSLGDVPAWSQLNQSEAWFGYGATTTYDAKNARFLISGPDQASWLWSFAVGDPTGQWTHLPAAGATPPSRTNATGVYDSTHGRFVLFGGEDADGAAKLHADTWAVSLGPEPSWSQVGTLDASVEVLSGATLAYAAKTGAILRFGGQDYGAPPPSAVFDATSASWTSLGDAPPAALDSGTGAWDPLGQRLVMFARDPSSLANQTWAFDLGSADWSDIDGAGPRPSARIQHSLVNDPTGGRMLLFGGTDVGSAQGGSYFNDVWALAMSGDAWTSVAVTGPAPLARANHAAAFDDAGRRMLVHGGTGFGGDMSDTWMLELEPTPHWVALAPTGEGPPAISGHFAAFDPSSGRFIVVANLPGTSSVTADGPAIWAPSTSGTPAWSRYCPKGWRPATADGAIWADGSLFVTSQGSAWRFDPSTPTCD